ncbi:MAG TPA: acyltransferase [Candidatus Limnocylindrales bacterium]
MPRSAYVDTLRALAIARVYLHHTLWIGWFTMVYPSMSVMFALAGFLTAVSLDRGGITRTVWSRVRRLLPPLWGLAAVAVPVMLLVGWDSVRWSELFYWVVPLANPTTSSWAGAFALALWYLRAYLWFVLLSPLLWWIFRRWPIPALLAPMVIAMVMHSTLVSVPPSRAIDVLSTTALYGTCWMLGYARHSGLLDRWSWKLCSGIALTLMLAAGVWAAAVEPDTVTEMFIGTAFVVILMRLHPSMEWLRRFPRVTRAIAALNARAVTIYVWHLPALFAAGTLVSALSGLDPLTDALGKTLAIALGTLFLALVVMGTGWIEDLAAKRRPALIPEALAR